MDQEVIDYVQGIQRSVASIETIRQDPNFYTDEDTHNYIVYLFEVKKALLRRIIDLQNIPAPLPQTVIPEEVKNSLKRAHDELEGIEQDMREELERKRARPDIFDANRQAKLLRRANARDQALHDPIAREDQDFLPGQLQLAPVVNDAFVKEQIRQLSNEDYTTLLQLYKADGSMKKEQFNAPYGAIYKRIIRTKPNGTSQWQDTATHAQILRADYDQRRASILTKNQILNIRRQP